MLQADDALLDDLLASALAAAHGAARILQPGFGHTRADAVTKSSPTDMVSAMDRAAEAHIDHTLAERRPDDAVLGEEGTSRAGTSGIRWIIDPLDGTTNYLFGVPAYAVSVAAERADEMLVGVVVDPSRDETWTAVTGRGSTCNGRRLRLTADTRSLADSLVATGFSYLPERRATQARVLTSVLPAVRDIRRFGSAALDLCWVAAGRVDAFYEWGLQPWDRAAGVLIATEAGAEVDDLPGGTLMTAAPGLLAPLRALLATSGA
jgi:fructose-1,6-bisphosphatase/inositol monophosphatase family enzyme